MWARPHQTWSRSPPFISEIGCPLGVAGGAGKLWIDITSAVSQLATRCLILAVGFRGQAIQWRHTRDRASKGRCHGNQFWDCISCKWTLAEDDDMRLSCKGWFVISHLSRWELLQTGDCQVENWHVNCQHSSLSLEYEFRLVGCGLNNWQRPCCGDRMRYSLCLVNFAYRVYSFV